MLIKLDNNNPDQQVVFATHVFLLPKSSGTDIVPEIELPSSLSGHQVDSDGVVCYGDLEMDAVKTILMNNSISYTLKTLEWSSQITDKVENKRYDTLTEAWNDLPVIIMDEVPNVAQSFAVQMFYPPLFDLLGVQCASHRKINNEWIESPLESFGTNVAAKVYEFGTEGVYKIEIRASGFDAKEFELTFEDSLNRYRDAKKNELNVICNQTIMNTFRSNCTGTEYGYDFDYEAQINMAGILLAINKGKATEPQMWKTKEAGPIPHTFAQIDKLWDDGFDHKNSLIYHYQMLKIQLLSCDTKEKVDLVVW